MYVMCSTPNVLVYLLVMSYFVVKVSVKCKYLNNKLPITSKIDCRVEFTNIKCNSEDKEFSDFEYCYLKSVNRSYKYLSLKVNLFQVPITNVSTKIGLYKRFSGYKPFLYNLTVDACKFLKHQKSFPIVSYFYELIKDFSNMNHSCPYDHDLLLDKLTIEHVNNRFSKTLDFPAGDYLIHLHFLAYGIFSYYYQ
ncbi:uncharacterized protein LOC117193739 isoform X1 [Drosophila miranda]|uniref:uncharacterized protein LOC108158064 isoform X1 n=1 Tax=Drosophila miranda TaxID=7229 RepID=UPI00143FA163|nr:uncharacterized protein LOC108158064 isoform X1 [Drosophila miranda]XP_033254354.1 uncharacterized protein LOC117193739 isoform X1 [Drosophila miranda]